MLGDELQTAVAMRECGLGRVAQSRGRMRHDDGRLGMALGEAGVNTDLIVGVINIAVVKHMTPNLLHQAKPIVSLRNRRERTTIMRFANTPKQ